MAAGTHRHPRQVRCYQVPAPDGALLRAAYLPAHLSYSLILRQVPMGHEKTIILVFIVSYFIIIILKKGRKSMLTCGNRIHASLKM